MGGGVFVLAKILQTAAQRPTKVLFVLYKHVSGINGDHEWLRMTNAFILGDLLWKVQKSHPAKKEWSLKPYITQVYKYMFIHRFM